MYKNTTSPKKRTKSGIVQSSHYYDRFVKLDTENKTIGIVLCKDKNDTVVEITLPENNEQIFASKYQTVLPSKKELKQLIENKINE